MRGTPAFTPPLVLFVCGWTLIIRYDLIKMHFSKALGLGAFVVIINAEPISRKS